MYGRRLEDTIVGAFPLKWDELQPGDYWKKLNEDGTPKMVEHETNLTGTCWVVVCPGPGNSKLVAGLEKHTVREHEDGTISVLPGDGSSNSILVSRGPQMQWHGYIYNGELREE